MIKEAIKTIVQSGGEVRYSFKGAISEWFSENTISCVTASDINIGYVYVVKTAHKVSRNYENINEAIDIYVAETFNTGNLALAWESIRKRSWLGEKDFEDLSHPEIQVLIDKYFKGYYPIEYPEFVKKIGPEDITSYDLGIG